MTQTSSFGKADQNWSAALHLSVSHREVTMHLVFDEELATLRAVTPTASLAGLGLSAGAAFTCWGVLATQHGLSPTAHSAFVGVLVAAIVLAAFFVVVGGLGYYHLYRLVKKIRQRKVTKDVTDVVADAFQGRVTE